MMKRREALSLAIAASTGAAFGPSLNADERVETPAEFEIFDTNVSLFRWPFRRLPLDSTKRLVDKLRSLGTRRMLAGSFEALLHRNTAAVNERLAAECRKYPELTAVGTVNLSLPDWETELHRCIRSLRMPGIRLFPNYHGYDLADVRFRKLAERCRKESVFVQIAASMEDTRTQPVIAQAADVNLLPIRQLATRIPLPAIQILNARSSATLNRLISDCDRVFVDISRIDGTDAVPELVGQVPQGRVMFGTHAPFLIPEAALIRVHESSRLSRTQIASVISTNATRFLELSSQ